MNPTVEFNNISKTYDGHSLVVRNLDLQVEKGEFLTLLGPSGSGKTTVLMMLAGFEAPTSGEILVEGKEYSNLPPHKRDIGVVFQNYALFPHMSVGENIAFPLRVRGMNAHDASRRVAAALDMVRLPEISSRKPSQLSGGQQQRVALARVLVYAPKIVLMDEPLGALDRQLREEMQIEIKSIHERVGVTVIYVTHDQGEALTMSDRVAIFRGGIIEQIAPPQALYDNPANAFVATFIGDSNLLAGKMAGSRGGLVDVDLQGICRIAARPGDAGHSASAYVVVRPEKIRVTAGQFDGPPGENILTATVDKTVYFGDHLKLVVRLASDQLLSVKTDTSQSLRVGQTVSVAWAAGDCLAFTLPPAGAKPASAAV